MKKGFEVECIVLKSSNYKEFDKQYTLFSSELGKFTAIAKGVRKINSKRLGSLDALNRVRVSLFESNRGIKVIGQTQLLESYGNLKKSMSGIAKGLYIAELVHRFFYQETYQHESAPEIYDLIIESLASLDRFYKNYSDKRFNFVAVRIMNLFESKLMRILGYEISLESLLLSKLELNSAEVEYLLSLKSDKGFDNLESIKKGYKLGDNLIKEYITQILEERIYSVKLF